VYFGHRKKISKYVKEHGEIKLECPVLPCNSCDFHIAAPIEQGASSDTIYSEMATLFQGLEDHLVTEHTKETKLTTCPYCSKDLSNLVYWVHLEEHMNQTSTPTTPTKAQPKVTTPDKAPANEVSPIKTPEAKGSSDVQPVETKAASNPTSEENSAATTKPEPNETVVKEQDQKIEETVPTTRTSPRKSKPKKSQEEIMRELQEIEKKIAAKKKEDEARKQKEEEIRLKQLAEDKKKKEEEEIARKLEMEETKRKLEIEETKRKLEIEETKRKLEEEERRQQEEALKRRIEEDIRRKQQEELKRKQEEELLRQEEEEMRKLKAEEERMRQKEIERKRKDEEERKRMEEELRRQKEEDLKRQVDEQMRLLREGELKSQNQKEEDVSPDSNSIKEEKPESKHSSMTTSPKSGTRSREISGDVDRGMRRRSISGDLKTSSVWNKDKDHKEKGETLDSGANEMKNKPVLTEEMERSIIYGGFKKKEDKPVKKETREDKLVAVRREIEARFKAEEERRRKISEEKRKSEEKEKERMRLAEEKLKREREKLKEEKRKTRKRLEELQKSEEPVVEEGPEEEENMETEMETDVISTEASPVASPKRARSKSPDQYEKIKMEIRKIDMEIEKKTKARRVEQEVEHSRSSSITPEPEHKGTVPEDDIENSNDVQMTSLPAPVKAVVDYQVDDEEEEEEELDDLEIMMREFQERESKNVVTNETQSADITSPTEEVNDKEEINPQGEEATSPTIPAGFDKDGHPLESGVITPTLQCTLCTEEGRITSENNVYESAYELLAHVFLVHRKKIVSRSRKARKMTLPCPDGCGFQTSSSSSGVSIDYFNSELPRHLSSLCDHVRSQHTGEDSLDKCPYCSLPLDHQEAWSWQHLANHRDTRRIYCSSCNKFPFKNDEQKCCNADDKAPKSLEALAKEVESGVIRAEDLVNQRNQEKRLKREKEEREIVIPRLPRKCDNCCETLRTPASWKYHVQAHKYGEVFCSTCSVCVLGHVFEDHKATCDESTGVKIVKYRGDTWLDIQDKKVKVFFDYEDRGINGRVTVATVEHQNKKMSGSGINHDKATENLKKIMELHLINEKENISSEESLRNEEQDRDALLDMFMELAQRDQVSSLTSYSLTIDEEEVPVVTDLWFSKLGKVYQLASVVVGGQNISEIGKTIPEAVQNLAEKIQNEKVNCILV